MAFSQQARPLRGTAPHVGISQGTANGENGTEGTSGQWLLEWFPGFDIPIGLEGRAYLRRLLNHRRAEDPAACEALLAAHGIKLGRGVPGHTSNWGSMKVKELLHAAYLLGCWSAVERLCINFCQANGLKTEWIQELKAKGGRQSVTLANLQNYRKRFRDREKKRGQQQADPLPHSLVSPAETKESRITSGKHFEATSFLSRLEESSEQEAVIPSGQPDTPTSTTQAGTGKQGNRYVPSQPVSSSPAVFPCLGRSVGEGCFDSSTTVEEEAEHYLHPLDSFVHRGNQASPDVRERHLMESSGSGPIPHLLPSPEYESLGVPRRPQTKKRGSRGRITTSTRGKRKRSQANLMPRPAEMTEVTYTPTANIQNLQGSDETVQMQGKHNQKPCYFHQTPEPLESIHTHINSGKAGVVAPPLQALPQVMGQTTEPAPSNKVQWLPETNSPPSSSFLLLSYGEGERRFHLPQTQIYHENCFPPCINSNHPSSARDTSLTGCRLPIDRTNLNHPVESARLDTPCQESSTINLRQQVSPLKERSLNPAKTRERSCSSDSWRSGSSWSQSSQASSYSTCTTSTSSEEGDLSTPCSLGSWKQTNMKRRIAHQVNFAGKKPRHHQSFLSGEELRREETQPSSTIALVASSGSAVNSVVQKHQYSLPAVHQADTKTTAELYGASAIQSAYCSDNDAPQARLSKDTFPPDTAAGVSCSSYESSKDPPYGLQAAPSSDVPSLAERHTNRGVPNENDSFFSRTPALFSCDIESPLTQDGGVMATSASLLEATHPLAGREKTCIGRTGHTRDASGDQLTSSVPLSPLVSQRTVSVSLQEPRPHKGPPEGLAGLREGDFRSDTQHCFPPQSEFQESVHVPHFSVTSELKTIGGVGLSAGYYRPSLMTAQLLNPQCQSFERHAFPAARPNTDSGRLQEIRCSFGSRRHFPQHSSTVRYDSTCALNSNTSSQGHAKMKQSPFDVQTIPAFECGESGGAKHASEGCLMSPAKSGRGRIQQETCDNEYGATIQEATSSVHGAAQTKNHSGMLKCGSWESNLNSGQPAPRKGGAELCFLGPQISSCARSFEAHLQGTASEPLHLAGERTESSPAPDTVPELVKCRRRIIPDVPLIVDRDATAVSEEATDSIHPVEEVECSGRKGGLQHGSMIPLSSPTCNEGDSTLPFSMEFKESSYSVSCGRSRATPGWKLLPARCASVKTPAGVRKIVEAHTPETGGSLRRHTRELQGSHSSDCSRLLETRYQFCCGDPGQPATVHLTVSSHFI
uniref:Uncharacterized protein n=1 Tax=Toxoplasma gondii COUG TaxID=1074873 RepID=A0A2G8Y402_TOXGO|nr:hypothetical protein TGCOUG_288945 [Toxoplasma gondii COUG]